MRSTIKELVEFIRSDFNIWLYTFVFIFLLIAIRINYAYNIYWNFINIQASGSVRFVRFFLLFVLPWFIIAIPKLIVSKKSAALKSLKFYICIVFILVVITFDSAFSIFKPLYVLAETFDEQIYLIRIFSRLQGVPIMLLLSLLLYLIIRDIKPSDMGLRLRKVNLRPFFALIIIIIPMIVWASFNNNFLNTYPGFKPWDYEVLFKIPKLITSVIYEFVYGIDFIAIEFAFRGLLVILIARYIGKDAVLPMAVVYCFLHFGKPEVETISSFLGGYFLGVVALSTRSIAPGVILHLSLAFMMDTAAYIQHYIK